MKAGERRPAERAAGDERGMKMPTRRTSEEEEDYDNIKEEDCAAAATTAATAAATAATTTGHNASSAATASDQAVAAVTAARRSGLRRGAVAAAADGRMPSLTPFFLCLHSKCSLHVAQNTMFWVLPSGIPAGIPDSGGFRYKLFLPRNDLIPTCVPTESGNSAEFSVITEKEAGPEPKKNRKAQPRMSGCDFVFARTSTCRRVKVRQDNSDGHVHFPRASARQTHLDK